MDFEFNNMTFIIIDNNCHLSKVLTKEESIIIPSIAEFDGKKYKVVGIRFNAFRSNTIIKSIVLPDTLEYIGSCAFESCKSLKKIHIPKNVNSIDESSLNYCNFEEITVHEDNTFYKVHSNALYTFDNKILIVYAANSNNDEINILEGTEIISSGAFYKSKKIRSITFPNSVISIGDVAFKDCDIKEITLNDSITTLGGSVFSGCYNLKNVVLPKNITTISDNLFYQCYSLLSINIPDSVTSIGEYSFARCDSLENIKLSSNLISIGFSAFNGCRMLEKIVFPKTFVKFGENAFYNTNLSIIEMNEVGKKIKVVNNTMYSSNGKTLIFHPHCSKITSFTIPNGVTKIEKSSFSCCKNINEIVFSNSVNKISSEAFLGCESLEQIVLNDSVEELGKDCFFSCINVKNVVLPKNLKQIKSKIFEYNNNMKNIFIHEGLKIISKDIFSSSKSITIHYEGDSFPEGWNNILTKYKIKYNCTKSQFYNDVKINEDTIHSENEDTVYVSLKHYPIMMKYLEKENLFWEISHTDTCYTVISGVIGESGKITVKQVDNSQNKFNSLIKKQIDKGFGEAKNINQENYLTFDNFNFKLAVLNSIDEINLIDQVKLFAYDSNDCDYTEGDFGYDSRSYRVVEFIKNYKIPKSFADKLTSITFDYEDDILYYLALNWGGEMLEMYQINDISDRELIQFHNLKEINNGGNNRENIIEICSKYNINCFIDE